MLARPSPSVSIVLPVYNGAAHLDEALGSLVSQDFEDFEVVVVDDGSTDATPQMLEAWSVREDRLRVIRSPHEGIVSALERGRAASLGRYLARMDADDIADPHRLGAQYRYMEARPDVDGCGCFVEYFPVEAVRDGARRYQEWLNGLVSPSEIEAAMFVECPIAHPTLFVRASVLEAVGGYRDRGWPEDYDLMLRLWAAGCRLGKVPDVLLRWREGPDRLSRTDSRYAPEAFLACKVHHLRRTLLRGSRNAVIWGAGPVGKTLARALLAQGTRVEAFVELNPRKIGQEIHGAPVLDTASAIGLTLPLHLAAVGQVGARERIVGMLRGAEKVEMKDFVAIA
jgi:GT2 family glycosyltransferase